MFRELVSTFYAEDDLNEKQMFQIERCLQNAAEVLSTNTIRIYNENHWLHDWCVRKLDVHCDQNGKCCRIIFSKGSQDIVLVCSGVKSIENFGELVSPYAKYPETSNSDSFAQVLTLWFDHKESITCYLLLDNERYFIISSAKMELFEGSE